METVISRTQCPVCERVKQFAVVATIPRQRYDRTCNGCGIVWEIERTTMKEETGERWDRFDWTFVERLEL